MGSTQQFSLKWNKYRQNWDRYLLRALSSHLFSDVMVACDGEVFQLHRVVLASCSAYFEKTLQKIPAKETPIVMLSDVTEAELRTLIEFMYCGEATIDQGRLESLLKAAERLQIRGLVRLPADGESSSEEEAEETEAEGARRTEHRPAAAAALASRAPWQAERDDGPAGAHAPIADTQTPPPAAGGDPLDVTRLLSISVGAADSPPVADAPLPPPPTAEMSVTLAPETRLAPPPAERHGSLLPGTGGAPGPAEVTLSGPGAAAGSGPVTGPGPAAGPGPALAGPGPVAGPAPAQGSETAVRPPGVTPEPSSHGGYKRNTSHSPHVQAAVQRIAAGELTVAEASIEFDVPIPTLYLNMRRQGVKARGRIGMTGKRKPRTYMMSQEMRSALSEIESGAITASKASRKYNITLPRIMSWMRKTGVRSAYSRTQQGPPSEAGGALPAV